MTIDGVSQTTGAERRVEVGAADANLLMVIRDQDAELGRALLPVGEMMTVLADRPAGPHEVGEPILMIEVRRNEVLLSIGGADAAVGLDDLSDAVAAAVL
jgi:hypothetical protein